MRLGGIDHTFWFDVGTGVVLRHVGLIDGEPCATAEFKDVRVNQPIPDETFRFVPPPDAVVEPQVLEFLRMPPPLPEARLEAQRAKHVPLGRPPVDQAAARSAIEYAYAHYMEGDDTGEVLVNIQEGRGLAELLQQAGRRIPGRPEGEARFLVDHIKFLRPDEAVVWFSLEIAGTRIGIVNGREGRAVLVDGRWMIEHATIVDLVGMAGVVVPPTSS